MSHQNHSWCRGGGAAGRSSSIARVVVIGGGVAGSFVAKTLQFECNVTLIDSKEYFEITWASLRNTVEPSFGQRSLINHRDYLTNTRVIVSKATGITASYVLTEDGSVEPYDYVVIATGHSDPLPKTRHQRLQQYQSDNEKIRKSKSILIVGGGPTGVELAGEIATDFPEKKITLVHKGQRLLEFISPKAAKKAIDWLKENNVEVKLAQSVKLDAESVGKKRYQTSLGDTIEADCHFLCIGKPVGSAWLKGTVLDSYLDQKGRLMVDEHLRVKGLGNVFAIGDITDIQELKLGYLAQYHAEIAAKNLKVLITGASKCKMSTYSPSSAPAAIVSLGRKNAVAELPFLTMSGFVPGHLKSRDLFVGKTRKKLGLDPYKTTDLENRV